MTINRCGSVCATALVMLYCAGASAVNSNEIEHAGLLHHIATDFYQYALADSVRVTYTVTNVTENTMLFEVSYGSCPVWIRVYNPENVRIQSYPSGCSDQTGMVTLLPGESLLLEFAWDQVDRSTWPWHPIEEPGVYTLQGRLVAIDTAIYFAIYLPIEVVDMPASIPDGRQTTWGTIKALYRP
jgi:hypothetical protein